MSLAGATALGGVAGKLVGSVGGVLDDLITSDEERANVEIAMERIRQLPELKELDERIALARHPSIFVAGAWPFVIWAAGVGIAFNVIAVPLLNWLGTVRYGAAGFAPIMVLDWDHLMVLAGLAGGTSWIRHMDKVRGVARNNLMGG